MQHGHDHPGPFGRFHQAFNDRFERFRNFYVWVLDGFINHRFIVPLIGVFVFATAGVLSYYVGRDFFPTVDAGLIQLHVRAPARTRIEDTEKYFERVEDYIRGVIPASERDLILDNIGLPQRLYNLAFTDNTIIGVNDGIIQISLKPDHRPTQEYLRKLRQGLPDAFPDLLFYFQPADMVTQILNFGVATQIDVQIQGREPGNVEIAKEAQRRLSNIHGVVDAHIQQELDAPNLFFTIDRTRAQNLNLNTQQIVNDLTISLSSSEQVYPNFWIDPKQGIPYYLAVQTPEYKVSTINDLLNTSVTSASGGAASPIPNTLGNVAALSRRYIQSVINHNNVAPVYDIYASVSDRDLGSVASDINKVIADLQPRLKPGNTISLLGQAASMELAFNRFTIGLLVRGRVRLSPHGRELPRLHRSARRHPRPSRSGLRHRHHAVHHGDDLERALADGRDYGHRRRVGELDPARDVCQGASSSGHFSRTSRLRSRQNAPSARADDRGRDGCRHAAYGDRRSWRGAELRSGARRDWRAACGNAHDPLCRPLCLRHTS